MTDWTDGYIAGIDYTHGYYQELNPLRTQLAFLYAGLVPPALGVHCELGFGQGLSVNIHAAASGNTWHGCDFNPAQTRFAQSLARASGAPAHLTDETFAEFCARTDLPSFDSIGLHGIWSWINDDNRAVIVDFVRRKLKVGGALYVSYNTQPGWAAMAPMRDLLTEHTQRIGVAGGGIVSRIDGALDFATKLFATQPRFAKNNPNVGGRLQQISGQNRNYLAHEYFNRDWLPMPFSSMAQWLTPAKVGHACSAFYTDHIDPLNLSSDQAKLMNEVTDPQFRETVRDFMVDQQFRKDYWVKGVLRLSPLERLQGLRALRVVLTQARATVPTKISGPAGEAALQEDIYNPILELLSDHKPRTLGEIEQAVQMQSKTNAQAKTSGVNFKFMTEAIMILAGAGIVSPAQDDATIARAKPYTQRLNTHFLEMASSNDTAHYLASPVTGAGVTVMRFGQLFLLAIQNGMQKPTEWAQFAWQSLQAQGQKLVHEGTTLESAAENLAELTKQAKTFESARLPVLRALLIA
ncbi:MAG: methyltransferase regulatory domain-containing protein [Rhodoferax sp.]|nr:methyltransferase regulatory domain-containing protein [Rhodoferax sp.]